MVRTAPVSLNLDPIETTSAAHKVVAQILQLLPEGKLRPGQRLPPERELAVQLGVSRATVVQALRVLEHLGVLETCPGSGRIVRNAGHLAPSGDAPAGSQLQAVLQLREARRCIEVGVCEMAAERATEGDLARLLDLVEPKETDPDPTWRNVQFHIALAVASHNAFLEEVVRSLIMGAYYMGVFTSVLEGRVERIRFEHSAILDAIQARDILGARGALLRHIDAGYEAIVASAARWDDGSTTQSSAD